MISYLYGLFFVVLAVAAIVILGVKKDKWKAAMISAALILLTGWAAYYFHFEQIFVKRWGGVMSISIPEGHYHIGATWKDDNLWIENYDPKTNTCHFSEYSKGNLLQGTVTVENCNPLLPQ
jgi:hypothetical protein